MPNRYEREIEEILRNLEHTEPRAGLGQKFGERFRRRSPRPAPQRTQSLSWNFSTSERFLIACVVAALIAGGYAYLAGANVITLVLSIISFVCLLIVVCSQWLFQGRRSQSVRYGNVTITPLRRGPFGGIRTQWNLLKLKLRYRKRDEK
jgi:hypothetical protein